MPPLPGEPLPGITPAELEEFRLGLDDFLEVETSDEGLGPAFNGTSCAACHNDGGHDGRTWDLTGFGEGLRNTVNLRGRAGAQGHSHDAQGQRSGRLDVVAHTVREGEGVAVLGGALQEPGLGDEGEVGRVAAVEPDGELGLELATALVLDGDAGAGREVRPGLLQALTLLVTDGGVDGDAAAGVLPLLVGGAVDTGGVGGAGFASAQVGTAGDEEHHASRGRGQGTSGDRTWHGALSFGTHTPVSGV